MALRAAVARHRSGMLTPCVAPGWLRPMAALRTSMARAGNTAAPGHSAAGAPAAPAAGSTIAAPHVSGTLVGGSV